MAVLRYRASNENEEEAFRTTEAYWTTDVGRRKDSGLASSISVVRLPVSVLCGPGDDLLSHVLRQSTIGAKAFDGRVRDGIGSFHLARATRPAKNGCRTTEDGRQRTDEPSVLRRLSSVFRRLNEAKLALQRGGGWRTEDGEVIRPLSSVVRLKSRLGDESDQVDRAISTGQLHASPRFHIRPIDVVVFHGSSRENLF